jgi:DNA-binding CsgD family transcriptional regulator
MSSHTLRKTGPIDVPPGQERLTAKQIAIAQEARRNGDSLNLIAQRMGISKESIYRHTKGIKPKDSNDGEAPKPPIVQPVGQQNNGGAIEKPEAPKATRIQIEVELNPDLLLMLAGAADNQGYPSLSAYLQEFALPWLRAIRDTKAMVDADTPEQYVAKLNEIAKGYVTYQRMMEQAKKEVKEDVGKSDGHTNIVSQKS